MAYAKHLIARDDCAEQNRGIDMVLETHLRKGMSVEEVRRLLAPAIVTEANFSTSPLPYFKVFAKRDLNLTALLGFDENDRLLSIDVVRALPRPRK